MRRPLPKRWYSEEATTSTSGRAAAAAAAAVAVANVVVFRIGRWVVGRAVGFVEALGKSVWSAFSLGLWVGVGVAYFATHLVAAFLVGGRRVVGKTCAFLLHVVRFALDLFEFVVEVAKLVGQGVQDFFTGHWDRLGHERVQSVTLSSPTWLKRLAALDDLDDAPPPTFLTAAGRFVRVWSERDDDEEDDRHPYHRGGYCDFWRYCRSIDLTRWLLADPLSTLFPELCDDIDGAGDGGWQDALLFAFRDLPVVCRWLGTVGVVLAIAVVAFRPLTLWALRAAVDAVRDLVSWTFRALRKCALTAARDVQEHLCAVCLREFPLPAGVNCDDADEVDHDDDDDDDDGGHRRPCRHRGGRGRRHRRHAVVAMASGQKAHAACGK